MIVMFIQYNLTKSLRISSVLVRSIKTLAKKRRWGGIKNVSAPDHTEHKKIKVNRMTTLFQQRLHSIAQTNPEFLFNANNIELIIPSDTESNLLVNLELQLDEYNNKIFLDMPTASKDK